jgi:2-keto-3-deoxy-L-rhamnonate aldolase RhmA
MILDMEHAPLDFPLVESLAQAASAAPTPSIVRVPWNDPVYVKKALDLGVSGVMIPYVNDRQEATAAVKSTKYPPLGIRGVAPRRASLYGLEWDQYLKGANDHVLAVLQIETVQAVKNIEDILSVDGIDVAFVGPLDLSFSAGYPGNTMHPKVQTLIRRVAEAGEAAGVKTGIHSPVESIGHYAEMGMKFIATGGDTDFLFEGAKAAVAAKDVALKALRSKS